MILKKGLDAFLPKPGAFISGFTGDAADWRVNIMCGQSGKFCVSVHRGKKLVRIVYPVGADGVLQTLKKCGLRHFDLKWGIPPEDAAKMQSVVDAME